MTNRISIEYPKHLGIIIVFDTKYCYNERVASLAFHARAMYYFFICGNVVDYKIFIKIMFIFQGSRICSSATKQIYEVMDVGVLNPAEKSTNHL